MHLLKKVIASDSAEIRMTQAECETLKSEAKTDDKRSAHFTVGNACWFQLFVHMSHDSKGDGTFRANRYNGLQDGQGILPDRDTHVLYNKDGSMRMLGDSLPQLMFDNGPTPKPVLMAQDGHRANENPILSAMHLMCVRGYNKLLKRYQGDRVEAKAAMVALVNRISLNETLEFLSMTRDELFNEIVIEGFHLSAEFAFALGRWAHPMMPETVNNRPLFDYVPPEDIDLVSLFDGSEMARDFNFGTSPSMIAMDHLPGDNPSILDRTFARHQELGLAPWQSLCAAYGAPEDLYSDDNLADLPEIDRNEIVVAGNPNMHAAKGAPMFYGMCKEAEKHNGRPGEIARRAIGDALGGSLLYGHQHERGLWMDLWNGAPRSTLEIIDYFSDVG